MQLPILFTSLGLVLAGTAASQCDPRIDSSGLDSLDRLGISAAVSADWAIVGAFGDDQLGTKAGAVYAYERQGDTWLGRQKILASGGLGGDLFGASVAADGTTLVVGAPSRDTPGYRSGSVQVFERIAGTYVFLQELAPADGADADEFGFALALDGDRLVVGARYGDAPGALDAGAAYIFERSGGTWSEVAKLVASDAAPIDYFGQSVDLDGDVVVVGAWGDDDQGTGTGAAYTFRASLGWAQEQKLAAHDAEVIDFFGFDVAVDGDTLIVGATGWDGGVGGEGALYVYRYVAGWNQDQYLPGVHPGGQFGHSLALDGGFLVASAVLGDGLSSTSGDAVYLVDQGGSFSFTGRLLAHDGVSDDRFGVSVALDGARALIGAEGDDDGGSLAGAVYGFDLPFVDLDLDGISDDCSGGVVHFCGCSAPHCGNGSPDGCINSTGQGATLDQAGGTLSVAADDLVLRAELLPATSFGLLFMGAGETAPMALGDGLRCVNAPLYRFPVFATGAGGTFDSGPGLVGYSQATFGPAGQILAGQTWRFQAWFRDSQGPCGFGSNTSNGLAVTFEL